MKKISALLCFLTMVFSAQAGDTLRVLFLGNSYTDVNNLPDVISKIAHASGDSVYYKVNAPGGYTFQQHSQDPTSLALIAEGNWDYVVLQEQSQLPSFEDGQVASEVYPYAKKLDSLIHVSSGGCAGVIFYMTWGRKNGDASNCAAWPPVCTYQGMDSLLQLRYSIMAEDNQNTLSPVAPLWHYLRDNSPGIELYQADESHPTAAGTYAAGMSFYAMLFNKNPINNSFNYSLSTADANTIKAAAQTVVYNQREHWKRFDLWPHVDSITISSNGSNTVTCTGINPRYVIGYEWTFGDGSPSSYTASPTHTYAASGTYTICLNISSNCGFLTICKDTVVTVLGINERSLIPGVSVYPNPATDEIYVKGLQEKTSYLLSTMTGTAISQGKLDRANTEINLKGLAAGTYMLRLSNDKGQVMRTKILKQ
jgi:hypothetical protein